MVRMIVEDGAAPPTAQRTRCGKAVRSVSGAWAIIERTIGAPQRCVTPWAAIRRKIAAGSTLRRQTWVAQAATLAHGYDQPLQWNIGSVHRYTLSAVSPKVTALPSAWRYAPRWL